MTLVALEGLDGVGKTTIADLLSVRLDAHLVRLPPSALELKESQLFADFRSLDRMLYYAAGAAHIARTHGKSLVVTDRYLPSVHALHVDVPREERRIVGSLPIPEADLTVCLRVDEAERVGRLAARGQELDPFEVVLGADADFRRRVWEVLAEWPGIHMVETSRRTLGEVVDELVDLVSELKTSQY